MVLFAVFIVVALTFAAFVIDVGSLRAARGSTESATEAAALGSGQAYTDGKNGCSTQASRLLALNEPSAKLVSCTTGTNKDGSGWVTIDATRTVSYTFGPLVGVKTGTTKATTTVRFQAPCVGSACGGGPTSTLRPLGICAQNSLLKAWQAAGRPSPSASVEIAFNPPGRTCSISTGEFLVLDFDGGNSPAVDVKNWNAVGYLGEVKAGDLLQSDQKVLTNGQKWSALVGKRVVFVIYDQIALVGKKTAARVSAFVEADVLATNDSGSADKRSITLRFVKQIDKSCCTGGSAPPSTSAAPLAICDVDGTTLTNCKG